MKKILCVGRGYVGKALAKYADFSVISHQAFLENPDSLLGFDSVVNTAGITGHRKCDEAGYDATIEANVAFASYLQGEVIKRKKNFIQLSTIGISKAQVAPNVQYAHRQYRTGFNPEPPFYVNEHMPIYPHNLYVASKILNEQVISKRKYCILRLPWVLVEGVFESRAKHWDAVQDTWCSILRIQTLVEAVKCASQGVIGTYHLSDAHVYFPEFINELLGKQLPIRTDFPENMTAAVPVSTAKLINGGNEALTAGSKKDYGRD